jgi:hypothetical protein
MSRRIPGRWLVGALAAFPVAQRGDSGACISLTAAQAHDRSASLRPERHATLHRGRAQLREERLVGLGRIGVVVLGARDAAAAL